MATRLPVTVILVRRLALASLVANVGIVLTGGAVRLTGSGLGCPTWPRCTEASWTATAEMGIHGAVEFGNRTLTFLLGAIALAGLVAAVALRPGRRDLAWLAGAVLAGIGLQAVIGGVTVWTDLNPWIVGSHFLVSMALIAAAFTFWRRSVHLPPAGLPAVPGPLRTLAWLIMAVGAALLSAGTVVTGSGPHAGDEHVPRNELDPQVVSQAHADLGFLLLGMAVAALLALRAVQAPAPAVRAAGLLIAALLGQGALGLVQYYTGLPELLVWLHLLGACLVWLAVLELRHASYARTGRPVTPGRPASPGPAGRPEPSATAGPRPAGVC